MSSGKKITIELLVKGGEASPGPPLGPLLGPLGLNILQVVNKINEATSEYRGLRLPVKLIVDPETKEYEVEVGIPTTSALIAKEAGISKGSSAPGREYVGNITLDQALKVARKVREKHGGKISLKTALLQVIGTCQSMGVTVEGEPPKEVTQMIKRGELALPEG
ncbi:TPA: 50S ribosomal protein L11 [Candidatus Micrarchaeota archaeon]|nr:50S ribosomal protein L11 [Candidatus Micrarchaeota archaeon]